MNEDLKPIYDIESCWEMVPEGCRSGVQLFRHKDYHSLYRTVDFKKQTIEFDDVLRVPPENVIDIYRDIGLKAKATIIGIILAVMSEVKPITMPYLPEKLKVFVEYHDGGFGILYFKDNDEDKSVREIKRFFKIVRNPVVLFEEIPWSEFYEIANEDYEKEAKKCEKK